MMPTKTVTLVELSGHLIDSLTLAKVMDKLQAINCDYEINEIRIGKGKQDLSYARLALWSEDDRSLETILDELKIYGGQVQTYRSVHVEPCPADGQPPAEYFQVHAPACQVLYQGEWIDAVGDGSESAIVFDPQSRKAVVKALPQLKQGEQVVVGRDGVQYLSATAK